MVLLKTEVTTKNAIYGRVSTEEQVLNSNIDIQKNEIERYLDANGLKADYAYFDNGISGAVPISLRPGGSQLLRDAKSSKFQNLYILRLDRIGRDTCDILQVVKELKKYGIQMVSVTEDIQDQLVLTVLAAIAEKERETIMQRMTLGINRAATLGKWPGGVPPYGYTLDKDRHLIIYDDKVILGRYSESDVVKKIFYLVAECKMSCRKVADILNGEAISTVTVKNGHLKRKKAPYWIGAAIRQLIKNEVYMGTFVFGKRSKDKDRKIVINVPSLVSQTTWATAQQTLKDNIIKCLRNTKHDYLLTGKIKCSECGRNFTGLVYIGYTYYACNNFRLKSKRDATKCINNLIRADAIENEIWKDIKEFVRKPDLIKEFIQSKLSNKNEFDAVAEIDKRKKKLEGISIQKSRLIKMVRFTDNYLEQDIQLELDKIKNEEKTIVDELSYYNDFASNVEKQNQKVVEIEKLLSSFLDKIDNPDFKLKKEIVRLLLKEVIVHPKNLETKSRDVEINYCFNRDIIIAKLSLTE